MKKKNNQVNYTFTLRGLISTELVATTATHITLFCRFIYALQIMRLKLMENTAMFLYNKNVKEQILCLIFRSTAAKHKWPMHQTDKRDCSS